MEDKFHYCYFAPGEMAERSNAAVLKTVDCQRSGGSNPSLSAEKAGFKRSQLFVLYNSTNSFKPTPFYVHVLKSVNHSRRHTCSCKDIDVLLQLHNSGKVRPLKAHKPYIVIYNEEFATIMEVFNRKHFLRSTTNKVTHNKKGYSP